MPEPLPVSIGGFPVFCTRDHYFRGQALGIGASYQFRENRWFHPADGAGVDVVRQRQRIVTQPQYLSTRDPRVPPFIPAEPEFLGMFLILLATID